MSGADDNERDAWGNPYPPRGTLMRGLPLTNPADGAFDREARRALGNAVDSLEMPGENDTGFVPGSRSAGPTTGLGSSSPLNFDGDQEEDDDPELFNFLHPNSPRRRGANQQASGTNGNGQGQRPTSNVNPMGHGTQGQSDVFDFGQTGNGGNQQAQRRGPPTQGPLSSNQSFDPWNELTDEGRATYYRVMWEDAQRFALPGPSMTDMNSGMNFNQQTNPGGAPPGPNVEAAFANNVYSGEHFSQQLRTAYTAQGPNMSGPPAANMHATTQQNMSRYTMNPNARMQPQQGMSGYHMPSNTGMQPQHDMSFSIQGMPSNQNAFHDQGYSHSHPMAGPTYPAGNGRDNPMQRGTNFSGNGSGNPMQRDPSRAPGGSNNGPLQGQIDFGEGQGIRPSQGLQPPPQAMQPPSRPQGQVQGQGQGRGTQEPGKPLLRRPYECKMAVVLLIIKLLEPAMYHEDVARVLRAVVPNARPDGSRPFGFAPAHVGLAMEHVKRVFKPPTQPNHQRWLKHCKAVLREDPRAYLLVPLLRDTAYWEKNHLLFFQGAGGYLPDGRRDLNGLWNIVVGFLGQTVLWDAARRGQASPTAVADEWRQAPAVPNLLAPEMRPFRATARPSTLADDAALWQDHQPMQLDEAAAAATDPHSAPSGDAAADVKDESGGTAPTLPSIAELNTMGALGPSVDRPQEE